MKRGGPLQRRKPMRRQSAPLPRSASKIGASLRLKPVIRTLRPDEPLPDSEPRRYRTGGGYIRLRWLVAVAEYVEEYEHRIVAGRPAPELDVHHLDGVKANNAPDNLLVCTKAEHARIHYLADQAAGRFQGRARRREQRGRVKLRAEQVAVMCQAYSGGASTTEVGRRFNLSPSQVSRLLRAQGVTMRPRGGSSDARFASMRSKIQSRDQQRCQCCGTSVAYGGGEVQHRVPRGMGGTSRPEAHNASRLVLMCRNCHGRAENGRRWSESQGWHVPQGTDPETWPIHRFDGEWVFLLDDLTIRYQETPDA